MSAVGGVEARKPSSSEQQKTSKTERSNTRSDTRDPKSDCERLAMSPLVRAMYEVVFAPPYCRINRHCTGHIPEFMQFATIVVDVDSAEAFANNWHYYHLQVFCEKTHCIIMKYDAISRLHLRRYGSREICR